MATDERNFRSTYYEKVGFRSVEEKRSLEILLKDKPLDKQKLKQFCLRFTVPGIYRNLLWKILLGVLPTYFDSHSFVMSQREQECKDLEAALKVMRITDQNTPKSQLYYAMWSLETGHLNYDFNIQEENAFVSISLMLLQRFDNDVDVYWLTKSFYNLAYQFRPEIPMLIERTHILIEKEDDELFKHLQETDTMKLIPFAKWFECCFAGLIDDVSLAKVWDKICGGSFKILVFVALTILTTLRRVLLRCNDANTMLQNLQNISEETADVIANKAIEMWQQNGCALTLQPESILAVKSKT